MMFVHGFAAENGNGMDGRTLTPLRVGANAYGVVYEIEGPIKTPGGRSVRFCSVWQVDTGTDVPRFITMYPR